MRIRKHKKQRDEKSSTNSISEHDDEKRNITTMNLDDFSSPASLTETRPELVAQIDQEIEINDHYKAVSKRNKTSMSNSATSTQFRKSGPYENYIPPPLKYVEAEGDGRHSHQIGTMTSSVSPRGASKTSHGKQSIKKETSTNSNIAERKGGDETISSSKQWEQHGIEPNQQASTKNSDGIGVVDAATDHVNAPPLSLHAQGLSSIRRLLAAGQTSNV